MPSALPSITTLPHSAPEAEISEAFDRDGVVILSGFLDAAGVGAVLQELGLSTENNAAPLASPVTALASKSPTTVERVILSGSLNRFLSTHMSKTTRIWHGDERLSNTSRPYLSATVVFEAPAGREAEPLHRHDDIYFVDHPMETPVEIWALVALDSEGDGMAGSCVDAVLGSHKWGEEWEPHGHAMASSVLKAGDCLLLHGSVIHRAGKNAAPRLRRSLGVSWTQGHMRQEENQFLNISKETAMKLDEKTQRTIGYKMNAPFGGWYELRDPVTYLQPEDKVDKTMKEFLDRNEEDKAVFQAEE